MHYCLTDAFVVAADPGQTWGFFCDARNLPVITPPSLRFTNRSPDPAVHEGAVLDYTIRWAGIPIRWRTLIIDFTPPRQFIDLQIRGPYAMWHHQHTFAPHERGTLCRDRVFYRLRLGTIGRLIHAAIVRRQLLEIFHYRREVVGTRLGTLQPLQPITIRALD